MKRSFIPDLSRSLSVREAPVEAELVASMTDVAEKEYLPLLQNNIKVMNDLNGFDVVIVCCSSSKQASFWQSRLEQGRGSVLPSDSVVLSVEEDWVGGAGNALGTLYAFQKAKALALSTLSINIEDDLIAGKISIGLFHTAGKGTRLAPLPGSENNNKPGVKLPSTIVVNQQQVPMTILEAVIKQTGCYAKSRKGRLSVFWGDQVFIPSAPVEYTVTHHVDILCSLGPMPTEQDWREKGLDKYGLIAQNSAGNAAQVEKVQHATAVQLLASLGEIQSVGASLGSFSLSHQILVALLAEFAAELSAKEGKLDSDPHLWMPMTLEKDSYLQLMAQKGISKDISSAHFDRIAQMMQGFERGDLGLFGAVDVGLGVKWWDYGQLKLYQRNTRMMTENTPEADLLRSFLNLPEGVRQRESTIHPSVSVDKESCISSCILGSDGTSGGRVVNSVLSNVRCKYIDAVDCVLINVTAERIVAAPGSIIYNYVHPSAQHPTTSARAAEGAEAKNEKTEGSDPAAKRVKRDTPDGSHSKNEVRTSAGDVIVGVFQEDGSQVVLNSHAETDGGKVWDDRVHDNAHSFGEVYNLNAEVCPSKLQKLIAQLHDAAWENL